MIRQMSPHCSFVPGLIAQAVLFRFNFIGGRCESHNRVVFRKRSYCKDYSGGGRCAGQFARIRPAPAEQGRFV